jgi:hypothetical protein
MSICVCTLKRKPAGSNMPSPNISKETYCSSSCPSKLSFKLATSKIRCRMPTMYALNDVHVRITITCERIYTGRSNCRLLSPDAIADSVRPAVRSCAAWLDSCNLVRMHACVPVRRCSERQSVHYQWLSTHTSAFMHSTQLCAV